MPPAVNLCVKFDANIFIGDRYMAILPLHHFGCEMPILAHFGEFFFLGGGVVEPLNVVRYCRDSQKAHLWLETCVCGIWNRLCRSVKKCDLGAR